MNMPRIVKTTGTLTENQSKFRLAVERAGNWIRVEYKAGKAFAYTALSSRPTIFRHLSRAV